MAITLKAARVDVGMSQQEVADALHIHKNTIVSYEKYRTIPDIETAKALASLYGRSVDEIRWR